MHSRVLEPTQGPTLVVRPLRHGDHKVVVRGGDVLLGRRLAPHGYGTWSLPSGKRRQGESTLECALRELREETGLEARQPQVVYETVNGFPESRLVFRTRFVRVEGVAGQPQVLEPDKTTDWRWLPWSELPTPLFSPVASLVKSGYNPLVSAQATFDQRERRDSNLR